MTAYNKLPLWVFINLSLLDVICKGVYSIISLYYSVLLLAGNDMFPQRNFEIIFSTVMIFASFIINANIFGNIAVLLQQIYKKSSNFQEKLEMATSTMKNINIPDKLQKVNSIEKKSNCFR